LDSGSQIYKLALHQFDVHQQVVSVVITNGGRRWILSAVYGSPNAQQRERLWEHLRVLRDRINDPWITIGDFNEICFPNEVIGGNFCLNMASKMLDMMEACSFLDLVAVGSKYTWARRNNSGGLLAKRLDRAIMDVGWRHLYPEAYIEHLSRVYSDHNPLLLRFRIGSG
jgi:endonuclease/exonuclease/phosphatase family metal-dependent hydrolase